MNKSPITIANKFNTKGTAVSAENYGCGHITDTFKRVFDMEKAKGKMDEIVKKYC